MKLEEFLSKTFPALGKAKDAFLKYCNRVGFRMGRQRPIAKTGPRSYVCDRHDDGCLALVHLIQTPASGRGKFIYTFSPQALWHNNGPPEGSGDDEQDLQEAGKLKHLHRAMHLYSPFDLCHARCRKKAATQSLSFLTHP